MNHRRARGLTLIEMLLTLTILALAAGLISGALRTALRSWQSGFARGREELVARLVLGRIAEQLRSVVPSATKRENEDVIAFDAREDAIRFVTLLSASGSAPAQVGYSLLEEGGRRSLVYREHAWPDKEFFKESRPRREERVREVAGLRVSVTKAADAAAPAGSADAEEPWSPADGVLPASVTVEIKTAPAAPGGEGRTYTLTVPLSTEATQ